ncbi:phytanoyl-CoA dioxygenase family protein [Fimbriimonas ginsengisoli]|uniref:Phytanoyl-CoA dioxygenase n=1 Tax=Fimbriimonas ginsengisoli Gsoil 348 TaxID=661478 RepID=A0A068NLE6_FIMGI|nr:phytanoyl-CoA dioxygenase family protein [Fimbriimonas ginsengisoli]AIE83550.1 Phytanoyl-CoA dioxygenase [Fimbriimonas ginsengisoli Gsoil 348]
MIPTVTQTQRREMDENGFTLFEKVFTTEEMADLAEAVEEFEQRMHEELVAHGDSGISRAGEITFTDHIAERDERVRAFVSRPEFVALTTAFLGPDTDLYWNQTVFKHPEGEREFPWHQDDAYTPVVPAPYLTLWLAINDATEENGCISVLPGSHLGGLRPHEQSPIGLVGYPNDAPDQGVLVPVAAGSIACFWSLTLHRSGPNRSKGIRKAYVIQYAPKDLRYAASGEIIPGLMPIARGGQPA